MARGERENG